MNASASSSSRCVLTPGRISRPSMVSVRATSPAASRIASISSLPLRYTVFATSSSLQTEGADHRPVHLVHRSQPRNLPEPALPAVELEQRRGFPRVHLEPPQHRLRRI